MSWLLDTCVLSELARSQPNPHVLGWISKLPNEALFVSVLTLGEIRKGVEKLSQGARKDRLRLWLDHDLVVWFDQRTLPVDQGVANQWGELLARMGRSVPAVDSLLAATALHHGLQLVTRNEKDFEFPGLVVFNPWSVPLIPPPDEH